MVGGGVKLVACGCFNVVGGRGRRGEGERGRTGRMILRRTFSLNKDSNEMKARRFGI